jgi:DNA-binding MarR family transcriptional regulator
MPLPEVVTRLQSQLENSTDLPLEELRTATLQSARYVLFSLGSGNPDQLGPLSTALTQITEGYFRKVPQAVESPREWMRSLAVLSQVAIGAYESFGPSAEARKILEKSDHARTIIGILLNRDQLQAAELRNIAGIDHQPIVTRIIHTLSKAGLVTVERGAGNTAWYRLTLEGRRAAKATHATVEKEQANEKQPLAAGASSRRY